MLESGLYKMRMLKEGFKIKLFFALFQFQPASVAAVRQQQILCNVVTYTKKFPPAFHCSKHGFVFPLGNDISTVAISFLMVAGNILSGLSKHFPATTSHISISPYALLYDTAFLTNSDLHKKIR